MVKITYGNALGDWLEVGAKYSTTGEFLASTKTSATWQDTDGDLVQIEGNKLKYEDGRLVSGTITRIEFTDLEHSNYATFKGEMNAKAFGIDDLSMENVIERLSSGNDKIIGSEDRDYLEGHKGSDTIKAGGSDDRIWAGKGDDKLWGGEGADLFLFSQLSGKNNEGHDTIYDFDAKGGGDLQDYIMAEADILRIRKDGHDTVVEFEDGSSITLIDVKRSDISAVDFDYPV